MKHWSILSLIILLCITSFLVDGQNCIHTDLSKSFNFYPSIKRFSNGTFPDSCIITVIIREKLTDKKIKTIKFSTVFLLGITSFVDCWNVRSYITAKNINSDVTDNDYGDLIVADFNFDGKEDIAVKFEEGGNGGPIYKYYIQTKDTNFVFDKYLSKSMSFFPNFMDKANRTLITVVHANAYENCETTYKIDSLSGKWRKIKRRFVK